MVLVFKYIYWLFLKSFSHFLLYEVYNCHLMFSCFMCAIVQVTQNIRSNSLPAKVYSFLHKFDHRRRLPIISSAIAFHTFMSVCLFCITRIKHFVAFCLYFYLLCLHRISMVDYRKFKFTLTVKLT